MKRTIIFFVLAGALLSGCSTTYTYPSKKITVYKTDGTKKDCALLSVRGDSEIIVLDWTESNVYPVPYSHAEILRRDAVKTIAREGTGGGINSTIGALACGAAGGLITARLFPPVFNSADLLLFYIPEFVHIVALAAGVSLGAAAGAAIGDAFPPNIFLALSSAKDREFLRSISAYSDKEPDAMRYIK